MDITHNVFPHDGQFSKGCNAENWIPSEYAVILPLSGYDLVRLKMSGDCRDECDWWTVLAPEV